MNVAERIRAVRGLQAAHRPVLFDIVLAVVATVVEVGLLFNDGTRAAPLPIAVTVLAGAALLARRRFGVAVEINSRPDRLDPPKRLLRLAYEMGCDFAIDSDAHAPGQLDWQRNVCERAARCGIEAERIVNTWPLDRLIEWTGKRDGG